MFTRLRASPLLTWEKSITRRAFYRSYFPLLFISIVLQTIATFTLSWLFAWITSSIALFLAIIIVFLVIKRLHDVGKSGYWVLLFLLPFANLWAVYLVFFKKGALVRESSSPRKIVPKLLAFLLALSITIQMVNPFGVRSVYAAEEPPLAGINQWFNDTGKGIGDFVGGVVDTVGKGVDQIKAIAKVDVPGIGVIDLTQFNGIDSILDKIPSNIEVPIPFTSFSIKYDRAKSPGENILSNIAPFLSGVVGTLDPMKPGASLARFIIGQAKPYFDKWVKPHIPAAIKNGAHSVMEFIKPLLHAADDPLIKNFLLPVWEFIIGPIDDLAIDIVKLFAEEALTGVPLLSNPLSGPGDEQMVFSTPLENQRPVGILESIDDNGVATGWAVDPDDPTRSLTIRFYLTVKNWASERDWKSDIGVPVIANIPRPDVTVALGFEGNHGFSFIIPPQYRIAQAGYRFLAAYADDTNGNAEDRTRLQGSTMEFKLGLSLVGALERIDSGGKITGWALNPNYTGLYHYSRPRVEFYADVPYDKGGRYLTFNEPYKVRNDIDLTHIDVVGGSKNQIGFEEFLDEKKFRDGMQHFLYAYVVMPEKLNEKILLPGSPLLFMMPTIYPIGFKYGYPQVARGSTLAQIVEGVPNKEHTMDVFFDGKVVDMNEALHVYPSNVPKDITYSTIKTEGQGKTRTVPLPIRVPHDTLPGIHTVRVRTHNEDAGVLYDGSFSIDVIPYELLSLETPDELVVDTTTEFTLNHIPPGAFFSGPDTNMILEKLTLGGELGALSVQNYTLSPTTNGSAKLSFKIPYEAGRIRKGKGPVNVDLLIKPKKGASDALMQAVQMWSTDYGRNFSGLTKAGSNPLLGSSCTSSLIPELSFVVSTATAEWRVITAEKPFEIGSGDLFIQGKGFGCYEPLSISMSAKEGGKELNIIPTKEHTVTYGGTTYPTRYKTDERAYFNFYLPDTGWEGSFEKRAGIELVPLDLWNVEHGTVDELLVTVKDAYPHSASVKLPLFTKYTLKVSPGEGSKELKPSGPMRIWWKGFPYGHKVRMIIDGESLRNVTLEKGNLETFEGRELHFIDDLSMPSWITPGPHTLTFEDISELDSKGKVKYRTSTTFVIPGGKIDSSKEDTKKDSSQKEEAVRTQHVLLSSTHVTAGASVTLTVSGFGPLGTLLITLARPGTATVKLSGYADYTDSAGSLSKHVRIPEETNAGEYTITVRDTLEQIATAKLSVDAVASPKVIAPLPEPSPKTSEGKTTVTPDNNAQGPVSCPTGSTYSYTFKQCIQDVPDKLSPYDGLPCPPAGSVPDYTIRGCIP